jgi:putative methyltransferase (TIGR04325 family)
MQQANTPPPPRDRVRIYDIGERIARNVWRLPVVGSLIERDYARAFHRGRGRYRGVYASFAEAEKSIPPGERIGFNHTELASMYHERMLKACASDYPVVYWMRRILEPGAVVYDFGGHIGISYHGWKAYLDYPARMRWIVYDLPAITRAGEDWARKRPSPGLSFTNDLHDAQGCTVFLAAGSLQFIETSLPALLGEAGCRPRHVIVNKLPLYDGAPFVTVQSAGNAFHPYQIGNRGELVSGMAALGYRVVDDWMNGELSCRIPFTHDCDIDTYSGYYFTRDGI